MRSERHRVTVLVTGLTVLLIFALGIRPVSLERIFAAYVLALASVALASFLRVLATDAENAPPSAFEHALSRQPQPPVRPPDLVRIEREITLGTTSAGHLHQRLLPLLRDAAVARLGIAFSRERLGDEAWDLLRPDRPEPEDRTAPGIALRRVGAVVSTLERL